jgi:hypothetical protein
MLGEIKQGSKPSVNQTSNITPVSSDSISIISVQVTDQQANHVLKFVKGTNGFAKVILSSQSNQMALTTVDLIGSDLTSLGTGSIKSILDQTGSQMILSFFIPNNTKNGTANICVDVYSDWPDKGGFPLAAESCVKVQIESSTLNHGNNTVNLEEIVGINDSTPNGVTNSTIPTQDIECTSSTNDTQSVELNRDNYLQSQVTLKAGQKVFPLLVQKICPHHVVGLIFYAYPVCCHPESVILHIGDSAGGCGETHFTLLSIQGKTATFSMSIHNGGECPICLSGNTVIDTPNGPIGVKELKIGMPVWTVDNDGHKQTSTISKTSKIPVPFTHVMIHLILANGRQLFVSPNHPTTDGRQIRDLKMGDTLDGVQVKTVEFVSYHEHFTYDILPAGPTGFYWANGILVGSTLK